MPDNKTYRIKTSIQGEDYVDVNLNLVQDISIFEMLSLKIGSENLYRLHTANYGCVAGRVLANNGIGVPNVRLSIFIAADEETSADSVLSYLYPYGSASDKNEEGIRYNLLPKDQLFTCHQNVGSFPSKKTVLDNEHVFEVFDKYYKFTTTTNSFGDYMIFGVPVGTQTLHMDVDLSDIGDLLSQRPRDFIYKGYNINQFENANTFKKDTNLETLVQIFSQDESVNVQPFWGEAGEMGELDSTGVRITRKDINLNYKFEPTCVFMGSLITDEKSEGFSQRCIPTGRMGRMDHLTTGEGTIEMIRKTPDGEVESFSVMGNQLIDGNGVWCYQIPMNLDYVVMDEYGNIVPTNDTSKGLPTRTKVRFRISLTDYASDYQNNHLTKMLVPNNPEATNGTIDNDTYVFGTHTPEEEFRDLFWNKVYSVKSYIPRLQKGNANREKRFSGIKAVNINEGNNPIPYNNLRVDLNFMFTLMCAVMNTLIWIAGTINRIISWLFNTNMWIPSGFSWPDLHCVTVGDGMCPELEGWYFAPGCKNETRKEKRGKPLSNTLQALQSKAENNIVDDKSIENENKEEPETICLTNNISYFKQCMELALAQEHEVIQFDFYNDWLNGVLYIPRWFANIRKKRKYFFGLMGPQTAVETYACLSDIVDFQRRYVQQCALTYSIGNHTVSTKKGCDSDSSKQKCHKAAGRQTVKIKSGFIYREKTTKNEYAYYFKPCGFSLSDNKKINYFATDIILIGSLSLHDEDGVPQTFKELPSSTYQMPTPLAATNMDTAAKMYGMSGGYLCSGQIMQSGTSVEAVSDTNANYEKWASTSDFNSDTETDKNEDEVTEAAGIDWGYTGPGQNKEIRTTGTRPYRQPATFENAFYQPGGHFLGISCFNTETNIKSCVNLSRICEIGVSKSQRRSLVGRGRNNEVLENYGFLIPTGLISGGEILDGDVRYEFATLNHNGLKVKTDSLTNRTIYDFIAMSPNNFDGVLKNLTESSHFKSPVYEYEEDIDENRAYNDLYTTSAFTVTLEEYDRDYYEFRLGLSNESEGQIKSKHLIVDTDNCSLPMYNNSFYFYFGLKDGATAIDRFNKEFFATCPEFIRVDEAILITIKNPECNEEDGQVTIELRNIKVKVEDPDFEWKIYTGGEFVKSGDTEDIQTTLSPGSYVFNVSNSEGEWMKEFTISDGKPVFDDIKIECHDFNKYIAGGMATSTTDGGYVIITWGDNRITSVNIVGDGGTTGVIEGSPVFLYANVEYKVMAEYVCGDNPDEIEVGTIRLTMPPKDVDSGEED